MKSRTVTAAPEFTPEMISSGSRNGLSGNTEHLPPFIRPGAMAAYNLPSRMGDRLHYRDGRVEDVREGGAE